MAEKLIQIWPVTTDADGNALPSDALSHYEVVITRENSTEVLATVTVPADDPLDSDGVIRQTFTEAGVNLKPGKYLATCIAITSPEYGSVSSDPVLVEFDVKAPKPAKPRFEIA